MPETDRSTPSPATPTVTNHLLDGRLTLTQPTRGHRAGTDAVLLARALGDPGAAHIIDLGAGVGTVGLIAALLWPAARVTLVEIDPEIAALAVLNIAANGLEGRVETTVADVCAPRANEASLRNGSADIILTNPPFLTADTSRVSPDPGRALAHVIGEGGLALWLRRASALLTPKGRLVMIHRSDALPDILASLGKGFGDIMVRPVQAKAQEAAIRVLVSARKGSRAPFTLLPPLVLHGEDGRFSPSADALHRGFACEPLLP